VKLTTHFHLGPRSRMCGAIPPLPQYVFMAWCSLNAQGLYLYLIPNLCPSLRVREPIVTLRIIRNKIILLCM
jgi:hypothetical protein